MAKMNIYRVIFKTDESPWTFEAESKGEVKRLLVQEYNMKLTDIINIILVGNTE